MQYVLSYEGPIHSEIGEMIMSKQTYNWTYGENDCQNYYEVKLSMIGRERKTRKTVQFFMVIIRIHLQQEFWEVKTLNL